MLEHLLLTLIEDQEPLSPALGRLCRDVVQGSGRGGSTSLAQPLRDLGRGSRCRVAGKRVDVPGLDRGEIAN